MKEKRNNDNFIAGSRLYRDPAGFHYRIPQIPGLKICCGIASPIVYVIFSSDLWIGIVIAIFHFSGWIILYNFIGPCIEKYKKLRFLEFIFNMHAHAQHSVFFSRNFLILICISIRNRRTPVLAGIKCGDITKWSSSAARESRRTPTNNYSF